MSGNNSEYQIGDAVSNMQKMLRRTYDEVINGTDHGAQVEKKVRPRKRAVFYATIPEYLVNQWPRRTYDISHGVVRQQQSVYNCEYCIACGNNLPPDTFAYSVTSYLNPKVDYYKTYYEHKWFCVDCGEIWLGTPLRSLGEFAISKWIPSPDPSTYIDAIYDPNDPSTSPHNKVIVDNDLNCIICDRSIADGTNMAYRGSRPVEATYIHINKFTFVRHISYAMCHLVSFLQANNTDRGGTS